ncbi:MAG: DUF4402 domain-containing protein [Bacteroidales bacterium]
MKNAALTTAGILFLLVLSFGKVNAQATATGHIFAEVVDGVTASISTSALVNPTGTITPATFSVSSAGAATFAVTMPEGPTTLTKIDGTDIMTIGDWKAISGQGIEGSVMAGGVQKVSVGATLNPGMGNGTQTGVYTGSYKVTFDYN